MSGKSKKNKAPKAKVPKDDNVPVEDFDDEFVEETAAVETVPENKGRAKADAAEPKKKKSKGRFKMPAVDPIILGSFLVFLIACLIVSGVTIYGAVVGETSDKTAEYGDTVTVDYTGSYFAFYDKDGAVIFDTSLSDVADNESYAKSYEFKNKGDSYGPLSVTIGSGGALAAFEDAIIGLKPGEETTVVITDGYGSLTQDVDKFTVDKKRTTPGDYSMNKVSTISISDYQKLFIDADVPTIGTITVKSPYGWDVDVAKNSDTTVSIDYGAHVEVKEYTENGVTINVLDASTDVITYEYKIAENFAENTKMLKTVFDGKIVYVIGASDTQFTYKTTEEKVGTTMYFVIKLVEISS